MGSEAIHEIGPGREMPPLHLPVLTGLKRRPCGWVSIGGLAGPRECIATSIYYDDNGVIK